MLLVRLAVVTFAARGLFAAARGPLVAEALAQTPSSNASLAGWLAACSSDGYVAIEEVMGRHGNHMNQLVNGLVIASAAGRPGVSLRGPRWNSSLVKFPRRIPLPAAWPRAPCSQFHNSRDGQYDCRFSFLSFCVTSASARRRAFVDVVSKYLRPSARQNCVPPAPDELVIHLRDGDVAKKRVGHHAQPPCRYFQHVADTGFDGRPFPSIRLVHQHARPLNKCAEQLARDPRVTDERRPAAEDACSLLTATNLALTASSFGVTLASMNARAKRLFNVDTWSRRPCRHELTRICGMSPWTSIVLRQVINYQLDTDELCEEVSGVTSYRFAKDGSLRFRTCGIIKWRDVPKRRRLSAPRV